MASSSRPASSAACALASRVRSARFPLAAPSWPTTVERPDPERKVGLDYDHEWSRRYPVRLARAMVMDNVARPAARLLAPATVRGLEHLQHIEGPVIFAANHASHIDTPLLLTTLPVEFRHRTVVAGGLGLLLRPHLEVHRCGRSRWPPSPSSAARSTASSADTAAELLEDGWNLVIFPEGGRSPDGWTQPFTRRCRLPGPAHRTARRAGLPARHAPRAAEEGRRRGAGARGIGHRVTAGAAACAAPRSPCCSARRMTPDEGENTHRFSDRIEAAVATLGPRGPLRLVAGPALGQRRRPHRGRGRGPSRTAGPGVAARLGIGRPSFERRAQALARITRRAAALRHRGGQLDCMPVAGRIRFRV